MAWYPMEDSVTVGGEGRGKLNKGEVKMLNRGRGKGRVRDREPRPLP